MARRSATAALVRLLVVDFEQPARAAERHRISYVKGAFGSMHFVAGTACSSFLTIDMQPVEILVAITELGQADARFIKHQVRDMATEAQSELLDIECGIELGWIFFKQEAEVIAPVRLVARCAHSLADWTVVVWVVFEKCGHISQYAVFADFNRLVMAFQAKVGLLLTLKVGKP